MKAEQLRKSILQLAIQGKLVPQDPNDEPASVLLERIRAEKQKLIKEGKIKKDKYDSVIFKGDDNRYYEKVGSEVKDITDNLPFEIPDSWVWVRHNEIFEISGGSQPPKSKFISQPKTGYVRLYQIRDYGSNPQPIYIPENMASKISKKGDILLARYGASLGKVFWAEDGAYNVAMARVIPLFDIALINKNYLYYYYKSSIYQETIMGNARSAQAGFNKDDLSKMFFPMPPLAEQVRIVSEIEKFEPLIAEYDKLEQQATKLDEEIYDKLKKSILQYAIQGKLVPQDPNDEPASVLLERIRAEKKAKLGKKYVDSFIYKGDDNCYYEKVGETVTNISDEIPFELPENWAWIRLGYIIDFSKSDTITASQIDPSSWVLDLEDIEKDSGRLLQKKAMRETQSKSDKHSFYKGNVLYSKLRPYLNKVIVADDDGYCTTEILAFDFGQYITAQYAQIYLMSPYFVDYAMAGAYGVKMPRIGSIRGNAALMPIPPLNEQIRIVEWYNTICKQLKDED